MLDLDKTDLVEGGLIVQTEEGIKFIPEEGATEEEKALFEEFRAVYPNGKPQPEITPQEPQPTETEILKAQLEEAKAQLAEQETRLQLMEDDTVAFQDYILSTIGGV